MEQNNQITRHAELVSASRHKTPQTLNQVQGDDNYKNAIQSAARNDNNIVTPSASRTMDPRNKYEDLSKFHRHSDCAQAARSGNVQRMIRMPTENFGFTLVELAIALMVIGLLIGGVLKGQELIENARVTATIRQFNAYETAMMIFRNSYGALPGDFKRPNRIPNCTDETLCTTPGNGNGRIDEIVEGANFFPHMTKAGVIQGPEGGSDVEYSAARSNISAPERDLFWPNFPSDSMTLIRIEHLVFG